MSLTVVSACLAALVLSLGCNGRAEVPSADGAYTLALTCVAEDNERNESIDLAKAWARTFVLSGGGSAVTSVRDSYSGCTFPAELLQGVAHASAVTCAGMPGTQFANEGGASLVERDWTLNTKASFFHDVVLVKASFGSSKAPDVPLEALQTCEGRVREARVQGLSALSYSDAGARWSLAGAAGEPCPKPNAVGTASGQLLVRYGSSRSELLVTEEGTGCTVKTLTTDGTIYRADDTECVLNSSGVAALGVTSRHFDSFVLDFSAKTWSYSARFMRDWKDTALQQCQEVSAQFEGDLAALAE